MVASIGPTDHGQLVQGNTRPVREDQLLLSIASHIADQLVDLVDQCYLSTIAFTQQK